MSKTPNQTELLSLDSRAMLLRGLARLIESGLPVDRAVTILAESASLPDKTAIAKLASRLAGGTSLSQAAVDAGLLGETDGAIAAAAEQSGNLELLLDRLATTCEQRGTLLREAKARLLLPAAVILLAALLAPLPGLASNSYTVPGYLFRVAGLLAVPAGIVALLMNVRIRSSIATGIDGLSLPLINRWRQDYGKRNYLQTLALALQSGLPALDAIAMATTTLPRRDQHGAAGSVKRQVMNGATVTDALRQAGLLSASGAALANAGEHAGALEHMLNRHVAALDDTISSREQAFAAWLPRLAYVLAITIATAWIFNQ